MKRKCLIISDGPVPTPEHSSVEGGGLRVWGLAKGLSQAKELEVHVAYNNAYRKNKFTHTYEGIKITTWSYESLNSLISVYDTILINFWFHMLSTSVLKVLRPNQQLVLDCNVPVYTEFSARESHDIDSENSFYQSELPQWNAVLRRGDVFLCANTAQKYYYQGVLSAIGRINPINYSDKSILIVPYGIHREAPRQTYSPITSNLKNKKTKKLLWFGGLYPWFDILDLVKALVEVNKTVAVNLTIVGGKNPYTVKNKDFQKRYDELQDFLYENKEANNFITFQEWIPFKERANWYLDSDLAVMINRIGPENELAWRTRLADFLWAGLPTITNGGDPLSEFLIANNAAHKLKDIRSDLLANELIRLFSDNQLIETMRSNLNVIKKDFYWDGVTDKLSSSILRNQRASEFLRYGIVEVINPTPPIQSNVAKNIYIKIKNRFQLKARRKKEELINKKVEKYRNKPKIKFISHQLSNTGAPFIVTELAKTFVKKYPDKLVEFHTFPPVENENVKILNREGIKPIIHSENNIAFKFVRGDVIVLNTIVFPPKFRDSLYESLDNKDIKKLLWYIHEDSPEANFTPEEKLRLKPHLRSGRIEIVTPAERIMKNYVEFFATKKNIKKNPYKYQVPEKYQTKRKPEDFDELRFILTGSASDGRKGQLPILYAFIEFKKRYFDKNPNDYRKFKLIFVGVSEEPNDFLSLQIRRHVKKGLGDYFSYHPSVSHDNSSKLIFSSNVTVCYSLREALPLFVFEGMAAGHPILRNNSSGKEEQLIEGKNGLYIDSQDFEQVIKTIEKIMNYKKISNKELSKMSEESNKLAKKQEANSYGSLLTSVAEAFNE